LTFYEIIKNISGILSTAAILVQINLNVAKKILKTSPPPFPPPSEGEGQGGGAKGTRGEVL
jgi:hypothetical protein